MTSDRRATAANRSRGAFLRDGDDVFRTDVNSGRDVEALGSGRTFLDLTPLGRHQAWEDSPTAATPLSRHQAWEDMPDGRRQGDAYSWSRRHDNHPTEVLR